MGDCKEAFANISVGRTRTGKTTYTKKILSEVYENDPNREIYIYDVNKEHGEFYPEPFVPFDIFMKKIKNVKNSFIVIEEASIFFESKGVDKELKELLVKKRHDNNIIYLNFHSFGMIPNYVFHLIDYVTVFKTNDSYTKVKGKFDNERLLKTFTIFNKSEDNFFKRTISLY